MSWLFSQALVEAFSEANSLDGEPFAPSNGTPTPPACLWRDKTTDAWPRFPSGMTCKPLTDDHGGALLKWFLAASHAPTYPSPAKERASTARHPACGSTWPESLAKFDPNTSSWRTAQRLLFEDSTESLETFPRWGFMRDGELWALSTPEHLTGETESGLLPTARATDGAKGSRTAEGAQKEWARGRNKDLGMIAVMWPTPCASEARQGYQNRNNGKKGSQKSLSTIVIDAEKFATPQARDFRTGQQSRWDNPQRTRNLNDQIGGQLNPTWVDWLMGWPIEWTDCAASATDKFRQWCASHGVSLADPKQQLAA